MRKTNAIGRLLSQGQQLNATLKTFPKSQDLSDFAKIIVGGSSTPPNHQVPWQVNAWFCVLKRMESKDLYKICMKHTAETDMRGEQRSCDDWCDELVRFVENLEPEAASK